MPYGLDEIRKYAFCDCTVIYKLSYYHTIEFIGEKSFYNCVLLNDTLVIPNNIKTIEELAFGNTNLKVLKFEGTEIKYCSKNTFTNKPNIVAENYKDSEFRGITTKSIIINILLN